jgi:DNA-binding transcriptional ArsR family regulator
MNQFDKISKALADKNRLKMIEILIKEDMKVSEVADKMDIEENLASHHLRVLSKNKLLKSNKRGREVIYSINKTKLLSIFKQLLKKPFFKDIVKEALKSSK